MVHSENLGAFIEDIQQHPGFVSVIEEGSVATGDPWQEGYSDHDLHVITEDDMPSDINRVQEALLDHPLGDTYLVTHHRRSDFVSEGETLNDLSVQYRSILLAGEDLVSQKPHYLGWRALSHGLIGLRGIDEKLDKRILNGFSWTETRMRQESYDLLKKWFCYNAAIVFGRTGEYPTRRQDVVEHLPDPETGADILRVTHSIATAERYELIGSLAAAKELNAEVIYPRHTTESED